MIQKGFFLHLKRMRANSVQYRRGLEECPHPPIRFWIEPTNHCNLRCPMCPTGKRDTTVKPGLMDMDLYRKVIDEISLFAVDINLFFRGESTIHPGLPEMIRYAREKGLRVRLETNATLLTDEMSEKIVDAQPNFVSFSFDGYTKEVYEAVRVGGVYEKTLKNIFYFLDLKKWKGVTKPFTFLQVIELRQVQEKTTRQDRKRFRDLFRAKPLDDFRIVTPHRFAGSIPESVTGGRFGYISDKWARLVRPKYLPCPYLWFSLVITWDGKIVPCCMDFYENMVLGKVGENRIIDVWNNALMHDLRVKIRSKKYKEVKMCSEMRHALAIFTHGSFTKKPARFLDFPA